MRHAGNRNEIFEISEEKLGYAFQQIPRIYVSLSFCLVFSAFLNALRFGDHCRVNGERSAMPKSANFWNLFPRIFTQTRKNQETRKKEKKNGKKNQRRKKKKIVFKLAFPKQSLVETRRSSAERERKREMARRVNSKYRTFSRYDI